MDIVFRSMPVTDLDEDARIYVPYPLPQAQSKTILSLVNLVAHQ